MLNAEDASYGAPFRHEWRNNQCLNEELQTSQFCVEVPQFKIPSNWLAYAIAPSSTSSFSTIDIPLFVYTFTDLTPQQHAGFAYRTKYSAI